MTAKTYTQSEVDSLLVDKLKEYGISNTKPFEIVGQTLRASLYEVRYYEMASIRSAQEESDTMKKLVMSALNIKKVSDMSFEDRRKAVRLYAKLSETLTDELIDMKEGE